MGKVTMGHKNKMPAKRQRLNQRDIEKSAEVQYIETTVEKPVYYEVEKPVTPKLAKENSVKIAKNAHLIDKLEYEYEAVHDKQDKCLQRLHNQRERLKKLEDGMGIQDGTIVHIRDSQASAEQSYNTLEKKVDKLQMYNKYLMIGIILSALLGVLI